MRTRRASPARPFIVTAHRGRLPVNYLISQGKSVFQIGKQFPQTLAIQYRRYNRLLAPMQSLGTKREKQGPVVPRETDEIECFASGHRPLFLWNR